MRASLHLLSLGEVTARYEPKTKHFPHCKNHRSSWPNKTHNSKRITRIWNHAYQRPEETQIRFIDNLIINPQFIGSRQTHRKRRLHRIDLHEDHGELCIEDPRERRSHLTTSYEPVDLWWTTHASSERSWCWWRSPLYPNPLSGRAPERALDGILRRHKLAAVEKYFRWSPGFFWNSWEYIGERPRAEEA